MQEVVIVGGGPVGLWLACELRLADVSVTVLERRTERVNQSRALTIHGRTLEVMALRGLADRFLNNGKPIPTGHFAVLDTRLDFSPIETSFPYTLFIPQARTEELIEERALELGVTILRGHSVEAFEQLADGVAVTAEGPDGSVRIEAAWVVGADGARSATRQAAGVPFDGHAPTHVFKMGDVVLGQAMPAPVISQVNRHGCAMVAPLGDGVHHRIVLLDGEAHGGSKSDPLGLDELAASAERILGMDLQPRDPIWLSRFDNETRLARSYRVGRTLLAGDAAHMHLPAGGQGMNVGIQDAMNLGWKLGAVIRGRAPAELIDTYEAERLPVGRYLHDNTLAQSALVTGLSPDGLSLRATMNDLLRVPEANLYLALQVSGFGVSYPGPLLGGGAQTDQLRVSDAEVLLDGGRRTTLFELLSDGRWLSLSGKDGPQVAPAWLEPEAVRVEQGAIVSPDHLLSGKRSILVRPDGYLAAA